MTSVTFYKASECRVSLSSGKELQKKLLGKPWSQLIDAVLSVAAPNKVRGKEGQHWTIFPVIQNLLHQPTLGLTRQVQIKIPSYHSSTVWTTLLRQLKKKMWEVT